MATSRYLDQAVPQYGTTTGTAQPQQFNSSIINRAIPGAPNLTQSASNMIGSLLQGMPGTSTSRRANAYFGGASGMPGSDFVRNRGFDLYNMQGDQRQQQGFQDLLSMISGYSQPMLQERGQDIQESQFGRNLGQRQYEFDKGYGLDALGAYDEFSQRGYGPMSEQVAEQQNAPLRRYLGLGSFPGRTTRRSSGMNQYGGF